MCGIAGCIDRKDRIAGEIINRMLSRIHHRGPDECGIYIDGNVGFGSVRLSIIDLAGGQQPIPNEDLTLWIVFNGEIFNYIELREELQKKGHKFRTKSDTEVILHLYEEYGENCVSQLNGQFVFSIWDKSRQELFLARDRVGIRPLFYHYSSDLFVYGSEIKAVFEYPKVNRTISWQGLDEVFTFWSTLTPNTVFEGIKECPPGHFMKFSAGELTIKKYWEPVFAPKDNYFKGSLNEAAEEFEALFEDAVRIRLRADVQVAAYLSGGLDSSITTAFIKKINPSVLQTFSIGFTEAEYDETHFQKIAADYFGTRHQSFKCTPSEIAGNFPDVIWHCETPVLRTSPSPMFSLSKKVRENNIKVVITGEGADEMLAGYDIFKENEIRLFWAKNPGSRIRPLLLQKLYPYIAALQQANPNALKMFFGFKLNETDSPFYSHLLRWNNTSKIKRHFSPVSMERLAQSDTYGKLISLYGNKIVNLEPLSKAQFLEIVVFLSGYLLSSQGDRMSMANSVEGRYPFLDHRIIEFCASLPPNYKLRGLNEKYLLKKMMQERLPAEILKRPKQAYRAPILNSFLGEGAPEFIADIVSVDSLNEAGFFNPQSVQRLILKMKSGKAYSEIDNMALTGIISTQLLHQQFIKEFSYLQTNDLIPCSLRTEKNFNSIIQ